MSRRGGQRGIEMANKGRVWASLGVYAIWIAITLFGARLATGGAEANLSDLVKHGIAWHFVAACVLLIGAIVLFRWNDLRFVRPQFVLRSIWFPALYLIVFAALIITLRMPPATTFAFIFINTMLVGFSEETMFRGVLFRAFEDRMAIWPAIILTSVLFGAVHLLNVFITGDLGPAALQSLAAALSGLVFMAILLRTGSIWPAIIYHGLWDCLIFTFTAGTTTDPALDAASDLPVWTTMMPILLNLPNVIFALIMLRNIHKPNQSPALQGDAPA